MNQEQKWNDMIDTLYHTMWKRLLFYANTVLQNPDLAAEAVQDVFRIACSRPSAVLNSENPRGWLMNTLKNVLRDIQRAEAKQASLAIKIQSTKIFDPGDKVSDDVNIRLMCQRFLGEDDYTLIEMVIFQKYTLAEAAQKLGITLEACKKRFQRAKKKLKKFF